MRKVFISEIRIREVGESGPLKQKKVVRTGYFHRWGENFTEFETGPGNFTQAIVERDDGSIVMINPEMITFETPTQKEDDT